MAQSPGTTPAAPGDRAHGHHPTAPGDRGAPVTGLEGHGEKGKKVSSGAPRHQARAATARRDREEAG